MFAKGTGALFIDMYYSASSLVKKCCEYSLNSRQLCFLCSLVLWYCFVDDGRTCGLSSSVLGAYLITVSSMGFIQICNVTKREELSLLDCSYLLRCILANSFKWFFSLLYFQSYFFYFLFEKNLLAF